MAETLSYENDAPTETVATNLTPDEQDSLRVAEAQEQGQEPAPAEEGLLAGKYKTTEELEKAYKELESKLGEKPEAETAEAETEETDKPQLSENASLIASASDEYYANGNKLSDETMAKFSSMSSQDLLKAYIEVQNDPKYAANAAPEQDVTAAEINQVKNSVGGDTAYANIVNWAKGNLPQQSLTAFNDVVGSGNVQAIQLAVAGMKAEYDKANGVEGRMVTGKAPTNSGDVFRSQQELVRAMSDPRYDNDPAYRQDIIEKLDRSDLEF